MRSRRSRLQNGSKKSFDPQKSHFHSSRRAEMSHEEMASDDDDESSKSAADQE